MLDLRGRRVVISGASSGIGLETARMLASRGAQVCLTARRTVPLEAAAKNIGDDAWAWPCDVANPDSVAALASETKNRWGAVDGLVNNAGVAPMARLDETTNEVWDETFAINVRGAFILCRELFFKILDLTEGFLEGLVRALMIDCVANNISQQA